MRTFASYHGVNSNDRNPNISYHTRVERVEKAYDDSGRENGWKLTLKELVKGEGGNGTAKARATWWYEVRVHVYRKVFKRRRGRLTDGLVNAALRCSRSRDGEV